MIVVDKPKLKFLLAGRTITVTVNSDRYKRGHSYSVSTAHSKAAICRVVVVARTVIATGDGAFELAIRQDRTDEPLLLALNPAGQGRDYVSVHEPHALQEPEPVDAASREKMSAEAHQRFTSQRATRPEERETMKLHERLRDLEARYAAGEASLGPDLRVVRQRLQALRRLNP